MAASAVERDGRVGQEVDAPYSDRFEPLIDRTDAPVQQELPDDRHGDEGAGHRQEEDDLVEPAEMPARLDRERDGEAEAERGGRHDCDVCCSMKEGCPAARIAEQPLVVREADELPVARAETVVGEAEAEHAQDRQQDQDREQDSGRQRQHAASARGRSIRTGVRRRRHQNLPPMPARDARAAVSTVEIKGAMRLPALSNSLARRRSGTMATGPTGGRSELAPALGALPHDQVGRRRPTGPEVDQAFVTDLFRSDDVRRPGDVTGCVQFGSQTQILRPESKLAGRIGGCRARHARSAAQSRGNARGRLRWSPAAG